MITHSISNLNSLPLSAHTALSTHTHEQPLPTVWGEMSPPNGFREEKPNERGGEVVARVCWTQKAGTVLGEGQCLYFPELPFPESICKYRCRGKRSFYFFFFLMPASSLFSRSIARIVLSYLSWYIFCETYGKWKFFQDFGNRMSFRSSFWSRCQDESYGWASDLVFEADVGMKVMGMAYQTHPLETMKIQWHPGTANQRPF